MVEHVFGQIVLSEQRTGKQTEKSQPVLFEAETQRISATPATAGLIALVLSSDASLSPREAARPLQGWAWGESGVLSAPDPRWGPGKARLPVETEGPQPCGRRRLIMPVFLAPLWFALARRRRCRGERAGDGPGHDMHAGIRDGAGGQGAVARGNEGLRLWGGEGGEAVRK